MINRGWTELVGRQDAVKVASVALATLIYVWLRWLISDNPGWDKLDPSTLILMSLPAALTVGVSATVARGSFLPIALSIMAHLAALSVPLFPFSNDEAYYLGKTLWASHHEYFIDPAMGISSGYPPLFHALLGSAVRITGLSHQFVTKLSAIAAFGALIWACWRLWKRDFGAELASLGLWTVGLALYSREWSALLLSSAATFSMAPAVVGWWLYARGRSTGSWALGATSMALAIALWPVHLFSAIGVGLTCLRGRFIAGRDALYALGLVVSLGIVGMLRSMSGAAETLTGTQLFPVEPWRFLMSRLSAIASLGTDTYGMLPTLAGVTLTAAFVGLFLYGRFKLRGADMLIPICRVGLGLFFGALLAYTFMTLTAYGNRLLFIAAIIVTPVAARGLLNLSKGEVRWLSIRNGVLYASLGALWIVPVSAATLVTAQDWGRWEETGRTVTEFLAKHSMVGDRIWAKPDDFCEIALGQIPVFGMLGHSYPPYYGAPYQVAHDYGSAYQSMLGAKSLDEWSQIASPYRIRWIVLRTASEPDPPWVMELRRSRRPEIATREWQVFDAAVVEPANLH